MALKLMYITNNPDVALIAEASGVDRIFVDMEYIGKTLRQGGMDTVQSHHTLDDINRVSKVLTKAELLVRINPIHDASSKYISSKEEIDKAIEYGAQILMLPYFKTAREVQQFIALVDGRAQTMPLLETPEAVNIIDDILKIDGIDEIFIGLNDLSLGYGKKFMFELLSDGTVENLIEKFKRVHLPFGFGGLASLDGGLLPGRMVLKEHYRLGSGSVILSRSFCNVNKILELSDIRNIFETGVKAIRSYELGITESSELERNKLEVCEIIKKIVEG